MTSRDFEEILSYLKVIHGIETLFEEKLKTSEFHYEFIVELRIGKNKSEPVLFKEVYAVDETLEPYLLSEKISEFIKEGLRKKLIASVLSWGLLSSKKAMEEIECNKSI